ncbi:sensor histidine kinase [Actinoplanes sp. NPDC049265]|uniref:sensor histidine kinase n=1 Tax=Actinoplanes sp. NPDC049265 TaxID=3363902 RepID=UPI0037136159
MALAVGDVVATARLVTTAILAAGLLLETAVQWHRGFLGLVLVLLTAGVCVAAGLRRRFPAWAALTATVLCAAAEVIDWRTDRLGQPAPIAALALLVVVASAVRLRPPAEVVAVAAGSGVVAAGTIERYATELARGVPQATSATLVMVIGWAMAVTAGLWRRYADARRRAAVELARRTERLALARDLHDVAGHHLTGLVLQAQVAQLTPAADPAAALAGIEAAGSEALASLRQVVRLLRDDRPGALEELIESFPGTGVRARLDRPDGPLPAGWPPEISVAVYRIVQEALTNVARHARDAREVVVTLAHDRRTVLLRIADDGQPGAVSDGGVGLTGMRERAAALGGTLTAGPGTPAGWVVEAAFPAPEGS